MLVIVSKYDHVVTPQPAIDFAHLLGAQSIEFDSDRGHITPECEAEKIQKAVANSLEQ